MANAFNEVYYSLYALLCRYTLFLIIKVPICKNNHEAQVENVEFMFLRLRFKYVKITVHPTSI